MTTFQTPLKTQGAAGDTGNSQTETSGFVHASKAVSLGATGGNARRAIVTLPAFSTLTNLRAVATSAFAADVSAVNVNWGNSADATRYGVIAVSAVGAMRGATVSGAIDFDVINLSSPNTMVITVSAVGTTTFTAGGVRAFVEYITVG
jgi:hypothetical protein